MSLRVYRAERNTVVHTSETKTRRTPNAVIILINAAAIRGTRCIDKRLQQRRQQQLSKTTGIWTFP